MICRKRFIDMDRTEMNSLLGKTVHYKILYGPEFIFRKSGFPQTVLIGNHHQFIVHFTGYSSHKFKDTRIKFQFTEIINLIGRRRFFNQGSIPVYKKDSFHEDYFSLLRVDFTSDNLTDEALFPKLF